METVISARDRLSTARRVGRIFIIRLHGRSTLVIASLVALVLAVALVTIRNGVTLGGITGSESTDDAYVRADQIAISSHIETESGAKLRLANPGGTSRPTRSTEDLPSSGSTSGKVALRLRTQRAAAFVIESTSWQDWRRHRELSLACWRDETLASHSSKSDEPRDQ
jgi:hypothetical protein